MSDDIQTIRGRWAFPTRKRGRPRKGHLMSDNSTAFCARELNVGQVMDEDWDPEEHKDCVCPRCLNDWWIPVIKKSHGAPHKAASDHIPTT